MCEQCKNVFLFSIYETDSTSEALQMFSKENDIFFLPRKYEEIEKSEEIGFVTLQQQIESMKQIFWEQFSKKERVKNKVYIFQSELLKVYNLLIVSALVDKKPYACSKL